MITALSPDLMATTPEMVSSNWNPEGDESLTQPLPDSPNGWSWWDIGPEGRYLLVQLQHGPEGVYQTIDFGYAHAIVVWTHIHGNPKALNRLDIQRQS